MDSYFPTLTGVANLPGLNARAAFVPDTSAVFREQHDITPLTVYDGLQVVPWGEDNLMPYRILDLIEQDETLATCQQFNAEVCYGSGLEYRLPAAPASPLEAGIDGGGATGAAVEAFLLRNNIAEVFLGSCVDFKHYGFAVNVVILNPGGTQVVRIVRKQACYCRFTPAHADGRIDKVVYANWREPVLRREEYEVIDLLDPSCPWLDLAVRMGAEPGADGVAKMRTAARKFAVLVRIPTADSTYYPIPYYASLFRGKWYRIKQLVGIAKEAKLKNTAPIKYQIEISDKYWESIFRAEGITDRVKMKKRIAEEKRNILDFLTGAENSGKVWFSQFYVNPNGDVQHDVVITKIDDSKEGGDWQTDIQEAVNMICFTMRVHSNLVGSVPGSAQTNNSGSDKRELYTIAHALQKPYHDLLFTPHRLIVQFNGWKGVEIVSPFVMLSTLDENRDAKEVEMSNRNTTKEDGEADN